MDKKNFDIDNILKSAYQHYQEQPSDNIWEKLQAGLDKKDSGQLKKGIISRKRIAILLLLLLSGIAIYKISVNTNGINSKTEIIPNVTRPAVTKKENVNETSQPKQQKKLTLHQEHLQPDNEEMDANEIAEAATRGNNLPGKNEKVLSPKTNKPGNKKQQSRKQKKLFNSGGKLLVLKDEKNTILFSQKKELEITDTDIINQVIKINVEKEKSANELGVASVEKMGSQKIETRKIPIIKITFPFITESLLSKSSVNKKKKKSSNNFKPYWTVTGFASNDWGFYQLNDNDIENNNGNTQDEKELISNREKYEPSFSTSLIVTRQFKKFWGLKTGVTYSNTTIVIDPHQMYAAQQNNGTIAYKFITSSGYGYVQPGFGLPPAVGDSLQTNTAQHNLQSISLPLMIIYKLDKGKFSIMPSAGLSFNFITKAIVKTAVTDALNQESIHINGLNGMRNFYMGFITDVNMQYNFNNRWAVILLPTFNYAITPITKNTVPKTYPYSFGIGTGLTYKF
jgi:hypothetical protein